MKMRFFTPTCRMSKDVIGVSSAGIVGSEDPTVPYEVEMPFDINGLWVSGTYEECLRQIPQREWQAAIVFLGNGGNENTFIKQLSDLVKAPLVGGSAAMHPITGEKIPIYGGVQAGVFLISDDRYNVEVGCENIHHDILSEHSVVFSNPRFPEEIDGMNPLDWYNEQRARLGLASDDFEHLTLSDQNGINVHFSVQNGRLMAGRDLVSHMILRYVSTDAVYEQMQKFYDDDRAVVFGCAGLKKILPHSLKTNGIGLFMYGEVCTLNGKSDFGNLMLSKIRFELRR